MRPRTPQSNRHSQWNSASSLSLSLFFSLSGTALEQEKKFNFERVQPNFRPRPPRQMRLRDDAFPGIRRKRNGRLHQRPRFHISRRQRQGCQIDDLGVIEQEAQGIFPLGHLPE
jgi:hypothetical protein